MSPGVFLQPSLDQRVGAPDRDGERKNVQVGVRTQGGGGGGKTRFGLPNGVSTYCYLGSLFPALRTVFHPSKLNKYYHQI